MSKYVLSQAQIDLYQAVSRHVIPDILKILQSESLDVNFLHPDTGLAPLHVAANLNFRDVLLLLIQVEDLNVDINDRKQETPLLKVVNSHGDREMILLLVQLGANIWKKSLGGVSPASVLFHQKHDDQFWLLIV
eukprot:gene41378-50493_t